MCVLWEGGGDFGGLCFGGVKGEKSCWECVLESDAEDGVGVGDAVVNYFVADEERGVEGDGDLKVAVFGWGFSCAGDVGI